MRALLRHVKDDRVETVLREFIADAEARPEALEATWEISARREHRGHVCHHP